MFRELVFSQLSTLPPSFASLSRLLRNFRKKGVSEGHKAALGELALEMRCSGYRILKIGYPHICSWASLTQKGNFPQYNHFHWSSVTIAATRCAAPRTGFSQDSFLPPRRSRRRRRRRGHFAGGRRDDEYLATNRRFPTTSLRP